MNLLDDSREFFDYDDMLEFLNDEEMRSVEWKLNYKTNSDYEFPNHSFEDEKYIKKIQLKKNFTNSDLNISGIASLLFKRRSILLSEMGERWSFDELEKVLMLAIGCSGEIRNINIHNEDVRLDLRTYPSGGALYPLKFYFYAKEVENLEDGFYYFSPFDSSIYKIKESIPVEELEELFPMTTFKMDPRSDTMKKASIAVFMIADYKYAFVKYGRLAYRLSLFEGGHAAQNIQLISTALQKRTLPICGFFPDKIEEELGIRKNKFLHCIYSVILG